MVYKRGRVWWYKFVWNGELIRESTKQRNKRTAEQMEAAHKTSLAKGEVGIREKKPVPTLDEFAENDFLPFVRTTFANKPKTLAYYENGVRNLRAFAPLGRGRLDTITSEDIAEYIAARQSAKTRSGQDLQVASINRELQVLRRMFSLSQEWGKVEKVMPRVRMLPGERHRERVITPEEEDLYLRTATELARQIEAAYRAALEGVRAKRGQQPRKPDAYLLRDECRRHPARLWSSAGGMLPASLGRHPGRRHRGPIR